ncbi:MAG: 30S ribosomal protein S17 [bacterium]|nr:30S ribosomal protein S17 [bacterium]
MNKKLHLILTGVVEGVRENTVRVKVARFKRHPIYLKKYTVHKTYFAVLPTGLTVSIGDEVNIMNRPKMSKSKAWQVVKTP